MAKRSSSFTLALPARDFAVPAYQWLYAALRTEILEGRLRPGLRLPATRDLASQYGLSRGTIVSAFELLKSEGYVEGSVGSGTYVSKTLPEELLHVVRRARERPVARRPRRLNISDYGRRARLFPGYAERPTRAFRPNLPALNLFPTTLWTQLTARCLRRVSTSLLMGCPPLGYPPLRTALAEYLATSRGVRCVPEQIGIVSGVQEALDLVARLFLNPGDRVIMEKPGYSGAGFVFEALGANISAVRVDEEGLNLSHLPAHGVRLVYVTPAHQFPLGITMSLPRRLQLLDWARNSGALIFEDDYDSEYRYSGRPIPALQGLDTEGSVLYAGSFSKVLFPSLRLGYLVIPSDLLSHLEAVKSLTSRHAPVLEQVVLCEFIRQGHFGRHLRRMRQVYAERLSVLLEEARRKLAGLLEVSSVEAGLDTMGWLADGLDSGAAAAAAAKCNVEVTPLSRFGGGRLAQKGLQLGFAALDIREIKRGVEDLAIALGEEMKHLRRANSRP
jgi:GntR family transcriptional regulator / MocR family aminotransferase